MLRIMPRKATGLACPSWWHDSPIPHAKDTNENRLLIVFVFFVKAARPFVVQSL